MRHKGSPRSGAPFASAGAEAVNAERATEAMLSMRKLDIAALSRERGSLDPRIRPEDALDLVEVLAAMLRSREVEVVGHVVP